MKYDHLKLPLCFAMLCVSSSITAEVEIYKETSPSGTIVFTDKPKSATAEKVDVEDVNTIPAPPTGRGLSESISKEGDKGASKPGISLTYQANITFPPKNHVVYAGGQDFFVTAATQPKLGENFTIMLEHNGQTIKGLKIPKISPGSHTVRALITDSNGMIVAKSQSIRFHVKIRRANKPRYQPQP